MPRQPAVGGPLRSGAGGRGPRAATPPEGRPGPGETRGRRRNGRAGAARWNAGNNPGPRWAGDAWHRGRCRRRGGRGTRAGRGRRRNGQGGAARWNASDNPGMRQAEAAWHRGRSGGARGGGTRAGRGRRRNGRAAVREWPRSPPPAPPVPGGGAAKLTRGPRSGDHRSARGRRTPPTDSWGVRRPRGGQDARPIRPRMGPGRRQAPRRPHDAGRPIRDVAGTWNLRRPARGGRP